MAEPRGFLSTSLLVLAAALGFGTFLPIGLNYLLLLLLTAGLLLDRARLPQRLHVFRHTRLPWVLLAFVVWPSLIAVTQSWNEYAGSRLFHIYRDVWVLAAGLMLLPRERRLALTGLGVGAAWACAVIMAHHIWGLPPSILWDKLLVVTGNASSQKMLALACCAGLAFWMLLQPGLTPKARLGWAAAWLLPAAVVATTGISRNAYLLLPVLPAAALLMRFRSTRAVWLAPMLLLSLAMAGWWGSDHVRERFQRAWHEYQVAGEDGGFDSSVGVRWRMQKEALDGISRQPLTGSGLGTWRDRWAPIAQDYPNFQGTNNPHNDYLLAGTETGLPGTLVLLALLIWLLQHTWRARGACAGGAFLLTVALALSALVNAPFLDAALGMSLIWLTGVLTGGAGADAPKVTAQDTM